MSVTATDFTADSVWLLYDCHTMPVDGWILRNNPAVRLLAPFTERAERSWPDEAEAAAIMRDGLAFLAEFCNGGDIPPADEPALLRSARQYVDRHYPEAGAA